MLIADISDIPFSSPAIVMVAQNSTDRQDAIQGGHVLGVCQLLNLNKSRQAGFHIIVDANVYFNTPLEKIESATAIIRVIQQPKHGSLAPNPNWLRAKYVPNDGYLGQDFFVVQVEGNGYKVKLNYYLAITDDDGETINPNPVCKGAWWKISKDESQDQFLHSNNISATDRVFSR